MYQPIRAAMASDYTILHEETELTTAAHVVMLISDFKLKSLEQIPNLINCLKVWGAIMLM